MKTFEEDACFKTIDQAFPKVGAEIRAAWGKPEFAALMEALEVNRRDRPRAGFPAEVFFALDGLITLHNREFPDLAPKQPLL